LPPAAKNLFEEGLLPGHACGLPDFQKLLINNMFLAHKNEPRWFPTAQDWKNTSELKLLH
jgi:hypothetical protein